MCNHLQAGSGSGARVPQCHWLLITMIVSKQVSCMRTLYDKVSGCHLQHMAVQSKLLLLPDELLLLLVHLVTLSAGKALRSCNCHLFRLFTPTVCVALSVSGPFTIHPYTATCIKSLTLSRTVLSDKLWRTVTAICHLDTLRLHSIQFTNTISVTDVVYLQCVCVAGITNFQPALQFILAHLHHFWYLEIHGSNWCAF